MVEGVQQGPVLVGTFFIPSPQLIRCRSTVSWEQ